MTMHEYIHEYDFYDEMTIAVDDARRECTMITYDFKKAVRRLENKYLTENVDVEAFKMEAADNIFARIGRAVTNLIEKIKEFFVNIAKKIKGDSANCQEQIKEIEKLLAKDPQLARQKLTEGIEAGTFSVKDINELVKAVESAQKLYEMNKLDEPTFLNKVRKACEKFDRSLKPIASFANTIGSLVGFFPKLVNSMTDSRDAVERIQLNLENFKKNLDQKKSQEPNKATAIFRALSETAGIATTEWKDRVGLLSRLSNTLKKVKPNSNLARRMDATYDRRRQRQQDKLDTYNTNHPISDKMGPATARRQEADIARQEYDNAIKKAAKGGK